LRRLLALASLLTAIAANAELLEVRQTVSGMS
jgi:hypothetical protein